MSSLFLFCISFFDSFFTSLVAFLCVNSLLGKQVFVFTPISLGSFWTLFKFV